MPAQPTDLIIDETRLNTDSMKWDKFDEGVIPMWVADMDFRSPEPIITALQQRVDHGVFGYTNASTQLSEAIINYSQKHYTWALNAEDICYLPGLVCALYLAIQTYTDSGDGIVVPGPVYHHINMAAPHLGRTMHSVPMVIEENRWVPDMEVFEAACAKKDTKMIMLCNPHNPAGTVYRRHELEAIHALAEKYDLLVLSDEIHCDLILQEGLQHIPFANLNDDAAQRSIVLMAPSKTFNIAGLGFSYAVIKNPTLRTKFNNAKHGLLPSPNLLSFSAALAAYTQCDEWHKQLLQYLRQNSELIQQRLANTPCKMLPLEATYLAWIDVGYLNLSNSEEHFLKAGVGISPGAQFGNSKFIRLNFGCSHTLLDQALTKLLTVL